MVAQTKKIEFFMLIKRYNLSQLSAKILEGETYKTQRNWQLNWAVYSKAVELEIEKTKIELPSGKINVSVYFPFSFHSVSQPVLSESLATLLDVAVNFQPEVSCRLCAIVSKPCLYFFSC